MVSWTARNSGPTKFLHNNKDSRGAPPPPTHQPLHVTAVCTVSLSTFAWCFVILMCGPPYYLSKKAVSLLLLRVLQVRRGGGRQHGAQCQAAPAAFPNGGSPYKGNMPPKPNKAKSYPTVSISMFSGLVLVVVQCCDGCQRAESHMTQSETHTGCLSLTASATASAHRLAPPTPRIPRSHSEHRWQRLRLRHHFAVHLLAPPQPPCLA